MRALPSVSVCIPVYRGEQFLAETIRSVLDQTYRDFELVVLDNASPDDSGRIARSFGDHRIRVETNLDDAAPAGELARGGAAVPRPADQAACAPTTCCTRAAWSTRSGPMEADPGLAVVAARRHMIDERSRVLVPRRGLTGLTGVRSSVEVARRVVRSGANPIGEPGGVLFRRAHYFAVGGWRPRPAASSWTSTCGCGCCSTASSSACPRPSPRSASASDSLSADERGPRSTPSRGRYIEELGATPHLQVRASDIAHGPDARPAGPGAAPRAVPDVPLRGPPGRAAAARDGRHLTFCRTSFAADTDTRLA